MVVCCHRAEQDGYKSTQLLSAFLPVLQKHRFRAIWLSQVIAHSS